VLPAAPPGTYTINERIQYKILSLTFKLLYINQAFYLYDFRLDPHQSSLMLAQLLTPTQKLTVVPFAMHGFTSEINFLTHFVSHILIACP